MTKPATQQATPSTQTRWQGTKSQGQKLKVTLIAEHSPNHRDGSAVLDLPQFFSPDQVDLCLIHATTDLLEGLPRRNPEPAMLEQCLKEGTLRQTASQEDLRHDIQAAGFSIQQENSFPMVADSLEPILHFLQESKQDLLILCGSHSPNAHMGRQHFFLNLTSHASISTLLLKRRLSHKGSTLRVLFGVDASEASLNAARKLGDLLQPQHVDLALATVQSPAYQENAVLAPYVNQEILTEALEANAGMVFEMCTDILRPQGFRISDMKILVGSAATELGSVAENTHPDLLVVGSHNHKGFLAWVMGSVSSQLLHWDTHNILVVR